MKQRWVIAALPVLTFPLLAVSVVAPPAVAWALLTLATPACAEPLRLAQAVEYGGLPPYEIVTIVRSAGLDPIDQPVRRGPHYVLHAIGQDDQEVRVIVSARRGEIIRIVPIMSASRLPPARGGVTMGPYERMDGYGPARPAPGYVAPEGYRTGARPVAPDDDDDDPAYDNAPRPPAGVPPGGAPRPGSAPPPPRTGYAEPPPVIRATPSGRGSDVSRGTDLPPPSGSQPPPSGPRAASAYPPPSDPRASVAPAPGRDGLLPPPPERFPQRAAPATEKAKDAPKPVKRAAAAAGPKPTPVPKPKPATPASTAAPAAAPATPATPAPEAAKDTANETAKEITKTPEPPAPAAETKPADGPKPSVDDGVVPH